MSRRARPGILANPIDRALGFLNPKWERDRIIARAQVETFRASTGFGGRWGGGYDAARPSNRSTVNIQPGEGSADSAIAPDLARLRRLSSDLIRNSGLAKSGIDQLTAKALGSGGLTLKPQIDREFLGLGEDRANKIEKTIKRLWRHWLRRCDAQAAHHFGVMERLALYSTFEMGDTFIVKVNDRRPGDLFDFKIQLVEAPRVTNPEWQPDRAGLVQGIEVDLNGRPSAIHIANRNPWDYGQQAATVPVKWQRYPIFGANTGRRNIIHAFLPNRIGQTRGVPVLAPVISNLEDLTTYGRAELLAAVINSCFAVIATSNEDTTLPTTGERSPTDPLKRWNWTPQPGMVLEGMSPDEKIESFTPGRPTAAFEPFWNAISDEVAAAIGFSGEVLRRRFMASYSASRAALLETFEACRTHKIWFAEAFHQECYEELIFEAIAQGYIDLPGWEDPQRWEAWTAADWIGPPRPSLDPLKEANAARALIDANLSTEADQTILLTGGDWETDTLQRQKERAAMPRLTAFVKNAPPIDSEAAAEPSQDQPENEASIPS